MREDMIHLGARDGLWLTLRWRNDYGTSGPVGATWGDLQIGVGDTLVWGTLGEGEGIKPFTWSWVELLEFFGSAWRYLLHEQGYPIDFGHYRYEPDHPGQFRATVESRWDALEQEDVYREDRVMRDFLIVHDLAQGLHGAYPPSLLLLRQGERMIVATRDRSWILPFEKTLEVLESFGQAVYRRIVSLDDPRSRIVRERWDKRSEIDPKSLFAIISGWDEEWSRGALPKAANDEELLKEYAIAARMVGKRLAVQQARQLLEAIHRLPRTPRPPLDDLWAECTELMQERAGQSPAQQGYALASALREHLEIDIDQPIDPEILLAEWKVAIHELALPDTPIDAVAVWGPNHGPAILINPDGPRSGKSSGRRSTLSHEIAHLLVDYGTALPVVEVLGGQVSKAIEQRANAFAAEFLLPRAVAGRTVAGALHGHLDEEERKKALIAAIDGLTQRYGTSHETTAWQARNSSRLSPKEEAWLQPYLRSVNAPFIVDD